MLSSDEDDIYLLLQKNLLGLTDLKYVFEKASLTKKQELIRKGFDQNLYYQNGVY